MVVGILTEAFAEQQSLTEGAFSKYIDYHFTGYSKDELREVRDGFEKLKTVDDCDDVLANIRKVKDNLEDNVGGRFKDIFLTFAVITPLFGIIKQSIRDYSKSKDLPKITKFLNDMEEATRAKKKELSK